LATKILTEKGNYPDKPNLTAFIDKAQSKDC
jgi:hypothetical protein